MGLISPKQMWFVFWLVGENFISKCSCRDNSCIIFGFIGLPLLKEKEKIDLSLWILFFVGANEHTSNYKQGTRQTLHTVADTIA